MGDERRAGAWQKIKELLRCYVDVIEWHRSPEDEREGRVDILLYERPALEGTCRAECSNWLPELATQRDDVLLATSVRTTALWCR